MTTRRTLARRWLRRCLTWAGCLVALVAASGASAADPKWVFGTELDVVPFLNDGYYLSAIVGKGRLRGRIVRTELTTPGFATEDGFKDNDLEVWAGIVDIYFKDDFKGWWFGPGLERWTGEVTEEASGARRGYETTILTLGGGYTWWFSKHFYLNPWAAVHIPIGGDRDVAFPSSSFSIDPTPEASIKIGVLF
jgi:hypothetical protein